TVSTTGITITCNPTTGPALAGASYTTNCTASGGKAPYTWSGVGLPFGLVVTNSQTANVSITGSLVTGAYNYSLQVTDSTTPTALQATYPFAGNVPQTASATITSVSPINIPAGTSGVTLNITGSGFTSGVTNVQFGSTALVTNVQSSTQLSATV